MSWFSKLKNRTTSTSTVRMAQTMDGNFVAWNGRVYASDIVRSCIAPRIKAIGKLIATHVRQSMDQDGKIKTQVNPEAYMRILLAEPNPYMSGQDLQERMAAQLAINKNAFALIVRDEARLPVQIYPIPCTSAEAVTDQAGTMYFRFFMPTGDLYSFPFEDLIFLAEDITPGSIFGQNLMPALAPLMEVVTTTDQGIIKAIKNSAIIRWLLKFNSSQRPEDIKKYTEHFAQEFLNVENGAGVAGVDTKADAVQINPNNYVPNAAQSTNTVERIYSLFNTNKAIVQSAWTEEQWTAYFEAEVEPILLKFQNEWTRKLFSRRERSCGNRIIFDASGIDSESTSTKLSYQAMVNRKAMTPNEWRAKWHMPPLPGGDDLLFWQAPQEEKKEKGGDG